ASDSPVQQTFHLRDTGYLGGSAKAAGELVAKQGGKTVEYLFVIGLTFLKGHEKLDAPTYAMIEAED
ncbi:adenine phosphoribosyltransferase, partial [Ceratobasidium sp. 428]